MITFPEIEKSRIRKKLLGYFFTNPESQLYVREASSMFKEDAGNLSKELVRLEQAGIFLTLLRGRQKYFSLNKDYPLYEELRSVIFKTIGVEGGLRLFIAKTPKIEAAFIYGSFVQGKAAAASDIDLFIIGSPDEDVLMRKVEVLEKELGREINYNIYPAIEFKARLKKKDSFIMNLMKRPKIMLKGNINGI